MIVHEAWDEATSDFPNGRSSMDTLHRHGLELEISMSEEASEESDDSLYMELASLAVCVGFEYVKINEANKTVSLAMSQCSSGNIRYALLSLTIYFVEVQKVVYWVHVHITM